MMKQTVNWIAAALMLVGAVMLIAGFGVPGLWISVITIGIALMVIDAYRHRQGQRHVCGPAARAPRGRRRRRLSTTRAPVRSRTTSVTRAANGPPTNTTR